jgi:ABC-type branched-subunit amino acid transport system substrate-binding protein
MPRNKNALASPVLMTLVVALFAGCGLARSATATIGNGHVRVALVLPLSADGPVGAVGRSLKNAAEMALAEALDPDIQLLVADDGGRSADAERAVRQVLDDGAEVILGPLLSDQVRAAGRIARPRGVPMIGFSNDATAATPGVYLLSYLPKSEIDRIVGFAIARGKHALAALLPESPYGSAVEAEFRDVIGRNGGTLTAIEHYPVGSEPTPDIARRLAGGGSDAILLADGADGVQRVAQSLKAAAVDLQNVQLIGTGLWNDLRVFADQALQGGWFAGSDVGANGAFAGRYRQRFGEDPDVHSLLAYDAVSLANALDKTYGARRFSAEVLTSPAGFAGLIGPFRFRRDGTNERALSVYRVTPSGGEVVDAAPQRFWSE